ALLAGWGHPIELGCALHDALGEAAAALPLREPMPALAAGVCASPLDAALHDAYGRLHGQSSYHLLGPAYLPGDLARFLGPAGAGVTLESALDLRWAPRVPGCVLVSAADPLTPAEVTTPAGDGLPECAEEWVRRHGFSALKLKVSGKDPREDAAWVADAVAAVQGWHRDMGTGAHPWVSVDPNEAYPAVEVLVEFLRVLRDDYPGAFAALRYVEQPIPRAIGLQVKLAPAAALTPILADESVTGLPDLDALARAGWSGLALKTCKSHTLCLLMAAWSHQTGRPYSLQDLTNPALAALHAVGLAARLRTLNGIELNAPQYTPAANAAYRAAHPGIFCPRGGVHEAATLGGPGLGYRLPA
ncbi:MAG TPA: enolase C-terminal domain-like protein, partial [Armatimonadota bacterium]|nr:enolase C-terminal domain-like protein [Armatimonadota bacterium]